jgi:Cu-processing system ATP-binding protein
MISVEGLRKRFGKTEALRGANLTFPPGQITALVGPNGSGKTTLIKTILGLVRADAGRVMVGDHSLNGDWRYRDRVGYMPQIPPLPENLTAAELFRMLQDLRKSDLGPDAELLDQFGLGSQLEKPLRTLSGGTRQKVNAVMALMFEPEVLILDEPTAGLDPIASGHLKARIREERDAGKTVIITSHVLSEVQELADSVAFLLEGTVRFNGPTRQLLEETGAERLEEAVAELMRREVGP